MREERPSYTARRVASQRAQLTRPSSPGGDPDAEQRLYRGLDSPLLFSRLDPGRMRARTKWFDDATVDSLARGVKQVVIVGAGYDGRPLRFGGDDVRWIEVDHPATQADKRRRVEALGKALPDLTFVAVDLVEDDLDDALDGAAHDACAPTLYICEGLLGYLPLETSSALFKVLRRRATSDSALAANFRVTDQPRWLGDRLMRFAIDGILAFVGEARRANFQSGDAERLLTGSGWQVVRQDLSNSTRVDGGSHGLFVLATPVCS